MPAATVLFLDVVGFSNKPTYIQKQIIEQLNVEVSYDLRMLLLPPYERPQVVALPTGDGMALAFVHYEPQIWGRETLLKLLQRLQQWSSDYGRPKHVCSSCNSSSHTELGTVNGDAASNEQTKSTQSLEIRFGIHMGAVELVTDINGKPNLCGDTINYAQRVMDAADHRQVLLSENACRHYFGHQRMGSEPFNWEIGDSCVVTRKHDLQLKVFPFWSTDNDHRNWSQNPAKNELTVTLTSEIWGDKEGFLKELKAAREVAFILMTGTVLFETYDLKDKFPEKFNDKLEKMWLFLPDDRLYESLGGNLTAGTHLGIEKCLDEWRRLLQELKSVRPECKEIKIGRCSSLGYYATYLDWSKPKSAIHVYPYVWGMPTKKATGFVLNCSQDGIAHPTYVKYRDGLLSLDQAHSAQKDGYEFV